MNADNKHVFKHYGMAPVMPSPHIHPLNSGGLAGNFAVTSLGFKRKKSIMHGRCSMIICYWSDVSPIAKILVCSWTRWRGSSVWKTWHLPERIQITACATAVAVCIFDIRSDTKRNRCHFAATIFFCLLCTERSREEADCGQQRSYQYLKKGHVILYFGAGFPSPLVCCTATTEKFEAPEVLPKFWPYVIKSS